MGNTKINKTKSRFFLIAAEMSKTQPDYDKEYEE